jgi:uncharacterized membrane protein
MSGATARVGLSEDLFDTTGRPMFGVAPLSLFSDAGLAWDTIPLIDGQLPRAAFANYEALLIGGAKVSEKELANDAGKLRIVARNGVGYDAVDTEALTRRSILITNTPIPVRNAVATTAVAFILALNAAAATQGAPRARGPLGGAGQLSRPCAWRSDARNRRPWRNRARACASHAALWNDDPRGGPFR